MKNDLSRVLLVGPIFNTTKGPTGQPGQLFQQLESRGYQVFRVSHFRNKILRLIHTIWFLFAKRNKYDVILLQSFGLLAFVMEDIVSRLAIRLRKPLVFTLRGGAFFEFYERHPKWVKRVLNRAVYITSPSKFLINNFRNVGIEVNYLPNGIDLKRFTYAQFPRKPKTLLWVRGFHEIYHPELAIEVIKNLKNEFPDIKLCMVGKDQGRLDQCKNLIREYNLENNIEIKGYVPNVDLVEIFHEHEIFISTTKYESFGNSLMEAGSAGIPIVCIPVGEIPYLWQDKINALFAERNVIDFSDKIRMCLLDVNLVKNLTNQARANAELYSWGSVLNHWELLLREISIGSLSADSNNN